jgi:UDP-N-acetylmuramoyl-tripeptide--D-alanyl-D-alanine ligase
MLPSVFIGLVCIVAMVWSGWRCVRALHMLQLDSYLNMRLLKWLWAMPTERLIDRHTGLLLAGLLGVQAALRLADVEYGAYLALAGWCVGGSLLFLRRNAPAVKKALVYTPRAKRILGLALVLCAGMLVAWSVVALLLAFSLRMDTATTLLLVAVFGIVQGAPLLVILANLLLAPVQYVINATYLSAAKRRLRQYAPRVVGITGSYGKTSTKYFLQTILSERYHALKTPQSFNTFMGVCRVVNEELQPQHQVFVVEMGAYQRGSIGKLARFVQPQIGVLTAIGPQHLERFKTLENIEKAKYELIAALPASGVAVFNNDDPRCRKLADRTQGIKVLRYGLDTTQPGLCLWAEEIRQSAQGLAFTLVDGQGNRAPTHTALLGRHNVLNLLGASCVALEMGLSLTEVARALPKIQPAPHRLQLLQGAGGVTVIDDSYNSNPIGAAEALEALREFKTGRRVLVTPGMVELGTIEAEQNEAFGVRAAQVCDYVLLVGPRQTAAILKGLEHEDFPRERIRVVKDLSEATAELQRLVQAGDVVLFENDLPDLYAEA